MAKVRPGARQLLLFAAERFEVQSPSGDGVADGGSSEWSVEVLIGGHPLKT